MEKKAITVDPMVTGRHLLGGAMVGGSAAALLNLVHMIREMQQTRKDKLKTPETDENTIVLTLPNKQAEITANKPTKPTKVEGPSGMNLAIRGGPGMQSRSTDRGIFGPRLCKAGDATSGWPTLTASALAALVGGGLGMTLVNRLYERQRERRLQTELNAAKQEYMDLLAGKSVKGASVIDDLFADFMVPLSAVDGEKQADNTFGYLNYPMATLVLLTLLGTGGAGYLTKKILDEKMREAKERSLEIPKVKRIVFRSAPETDPNKMASADDVESVAGGLLVTMDRIGKTERFVGNESVKRALDESKMTKEALLSSSADWDTITSTLQQNPQLRKALYGAYVDYTSKGPFSRTMRRLMLSMPGAGRLADKRLYATIGGLRTMGGQAAVPKVAQAIPTTGGEAILPFAHLGASIFGGAVGKELLNKDLTPDELAKLIVVAQERAAEQKRMQGMKEPGVVQIGAADPKAKQYLTKNQKQIEALVKRLAAEGQV